MLFSKFPKHHTFIVDEDIFPVLNELQSFKVKDLRLLISNVGRSTYEGQENDLRILTDILEALNKDDALGLPQTYTFPRPAEFSNFKEITNAAHRSSSKINGEIISFFTSNSFTVELSDIEDTGGEREVYFITKRGLPEDKKIIVLSATVNKFLYDHVFVDFNWLDISHVEHAGRCIQFSDLSHSRSTLANENNKKVLSRIVHFLGTTAVITFKKYQNLFEHSVDICIENCSGFDGLKGRDIAVIGTPHLPVTVYKMIAFALGIDFTDEDLEMSEQLVIHNGYRFKIMTFNHIGLRNIQFHFIESALVQACGRGRTIRENSTVYLFANYPLVGFEQRSSNELPDPEFIDLPDIDILRDQGRIIHLPSASGSIAS